MIKAYIKYWKKAGDFKTYSSRSDYWWVFLANFIIFAILSFFNVMIMIPRAAKIMNQAGDSSQTEIIRQVTDLYTNPTGGALVIIIITAIAGLAILIPSVSLTARRLRDARLPWWISLIFGLAAIYGLLTMFIHQEMLQQLGFIFNLITFIVYILCLFPTKYGVEEEDDSRSYE
ncbi:DUF805 domain-containing protein [Lactococcus cremoris]|uniref:Membrane protein n=2 Tax=Lactococcus lactis subsp. cremoris TaxID=1359 RepID=A0ABR5EEY6_LACLC|nr:DUF805 domain-containing protein [Lactococcus cremoris]KEY61351.1 putative membrane protein [Lactococcus cremoris subsp. cremoris GE214]KKW71103.1 membrane protein [Lactococcus cremoris]TNU77194.1 DUF805 domain-containing protein [Lactococcus cremoris]